MALTRPTFNNINSNVLARFNDPLVVLNAANTSPNNQDIGFIVNRGSSGNVAMVWNETIDSFVLVYTSTSGISDGNVAVTGNANLQLGNLNTVGTSTFAGNMTVGHILPSANAAYDLGSPTVRFRTLYITGNTIDMGGATIKATDKGFRMSSKSGSYFDFDDDYGFMQNTTSTNNAGTFSNLVVNGPVTITGCLTVTGSTTTINSTTMTVNDKNIVVANNQTTGSGIDGAGVDAGGSTPIATWRYNNSTTSWQSNVGITPAVTNTLSLGGASNYWNNIYATTHTGTTGTFSGTVTAATINAATIGNVGSAHVGASVSAATIGNTGASLTGTLQTAAQTNITSVGTLTGLTLSGTLTGTTINAATIGNTGATLVGTTANVAGNATVVGNLTAGNVLANGYFYANGLPYGGSGGSPGGSNTQIQYNNNGIFSGAAGLTTNGTNLTATAGIQNTPIGNVTANTGAFTTLSATGTFTGTTINAATIGNSGAALTGTLQTAAQTNVTSLGTLTGLTLSGTLNGTTIQAATIGNASAAYTGATMTLTSTINAAGTATLNAVSANTTVAATGNVSGGNITTAGQLVSSVATGTAPLVVASTTKVSNLNVEQVDGYHADPLNTASTIVVRDASKNIAVSNISMAGSTSGTVTIVPNAAAGTTVITFPATTGTVVTTGDTGTVTGTMIAANTIVDADISTSAAITVSKLAASTISGITLGNNLNSLTVNNSGTGTASGGTYNGSAAVTISHNTIGAAPQAGNSSIVTVGNITSGTWSSTDIGIAYGGTGQSTAQLALNALAGNTTTSGSYLRGNGTAIVMSTIQAADVPTLNQNTTGSAGSVTNALTFSNGGAGDASTSTYNGGTARTISHNSIGAAPQAGNASIVTVGNITSGTWSATLGAVSAANLTNLPAGQLTGTIPSAVLGNSTHYVGTTAIALNRASAAQSLTGVSIDGSASTVTTAAQGNITSVGVLTSLTVSGAVGSGTSVTAPYFTSNVATGTAPLTVTSTTKVTNLNAEMVDGVHADTAYNSFGAGTLPIRHSSGYLFSNYFNMTADQTTGSATRIAVETGSDNYLRWQTPAQFITNSKIVDYKNHTAQFTLSGGGTVTYNGSAVLWSARVIAIPVENTEFSSNGYIDINCPTSGTVTYYNGSNVTTTLTCTAAGIPLAAWEAIYYQVTEGQTNVSDPTKFRVVNYVNSTWSPGPGWILLCARNGDDNTIKWLPGQKTIPSGGIYYTTSDTHSWAALTAKYADLAEKYVSDADYPPGTVVSFGGDYEITQTVNDHDTAVAGVISTNPAYLMNYEVKGLALSVALQGRVPCQVQGPVNKGDVLVSGKHPGIAQKLDSSKYQPGCVIGKALENISTTEVKTIEVVVGRF